MSREPEDAPKRGFWSPLIQRLEHRLDLTCQQFITLLSLSLEQPLSPAQRFRQGIHRSICRICRTQEKRWHQLRALAKELGQEKVPESSLSDARLEGIRRALEAQTPSSEPPKG